MPFIPSLSPLRWFAKLKGSANAAAAPGRYEVISVRQHCLASGDRYVETAPGTAIEEPQPAFYAETHEAQGYRGDITAPSQYYAEISGCTAFQNANFIIGSDGKLIDDLFDHPLADTFLPLDFSNYSAAPKPRIEYLGKGATLHDAPSRAGHFECGLKMFGTHAHHYGHWIREYLPRMFLFDSDAFPADYPLIVDDKMPPQHYQALDILNSRKRAVILLKEGAYSFERLGVVPTPIVFPTDFRPGRLYYDAIWPKEIGATLGARIAGEVSRRTKRSPNPRRKIFISRAAYPNRKLLNEREVADHLAKRGFEIIKPEELSFPEQVATFMDAATIVGSCNAGLSNCIFSAPGTNVVGLIHRFPAFNFREFKSFIESGGQSLVFLRGDTPEGQRIHPFHWSYSIDIQTLSDLLDGMRI